MRSFRPWSPRGDLDPDLQDPMLDLMYDVDGIALDRGLRIDLIPDGVRRDPLQGRKMTLHWDEFLCFQVSDESYREDLWISDRNKARTFYVSSDSPYLQAYKERSVLFPDQALHFLLVGTDLIVDVLASTFPRVVITEE